ncbi:hypothetical protein ABGB12_15975 [Actinocorallia sp. B10E7]|uniref:hypothetical protein n=1 Tax=Actinocorallia sp. B10E7 TaxID=3153558 RepID=UPI00325E18DF
MEIRFTRLPEDRCEISVTGRKGPDFRLPAVRVGHLLPHDLVHAAVERSLGLEDGFWGSIARGAKLEAAEPVEPPQEEPPPEDLPQEGLDDRAATEQKRRAAAREALLRRGGNGVMDAEIKVNWAYRDWRGLPQPSPGPGPLDEDERARAREAIGEAAELWAGIPEGGDLVWRW